MRERGGVVVLVLGNKKKQVGFMNDRAAAGWSGR